MSSRSVRETRLMKMNMMLSYAAGIMDGYSAERISRPRIPCLKYPSLQSIDLDWISVRLISVFIPHMESVFMKSIQPPELKVKRWQTMPIRSNVICRLNASFRSALSRDYFKRSSSYGWEEQVFRDKKGNEYSIRHGSTVCCGLDELDFGPLNDLWKETDLLYKLTSNQWKELIAKYIKESCDRTDERVVFVGIPTRVGGDSMYDLDFYEKLRRTLNEFGFRELCHPYKNRNSGNDIVVLAGQMPE
jgi:hypothetical protein